MAVGPGVERLAEEVATRFPGRRAIVMSSDIVGGVQRLRAGTRSIEQGEVDIVIGTQLVAKGHNFPLLTLVGVVDGDLGLAFGDMRAAERTFQLLSQVTGRAGRAGGASRALVQTFAPEHPVIRAIVCRRPRGLLPERDRGAARGRAAALRPARRHRRLGPRPRLGAGLRDCLPPRRAARRRIRVLGPAEAPLAVVRGRHRFRLLVHAPRNTDIQAYLQDWLAAAPTPRGSLRVQVDIDPQSFL